MIPFDPSEKVQIIDFERVCVCKNNEGTYSGLLHSILKAMDFLFLFFNVFFFRDNFVTKYRHYVTIYKKADRYVKGLLPKLQSRPNLQAINVKILNLFQFVFPDYLEGNVNHVSRSLTRLNNDLKDLFNMNVKYWYDHKPETFHQYISRNKYSSL